MKNRIINLTPAITNMSKELLKIAGEQQVYYRTKNFVSTVKENEDMLLKLIGCKGGRVAFLTASGTGAMEAAVINFIREWDKVLVINGGMFGQRWFEMCKIYNKKTIAYSLPFGKKIIFKQLEQYIKSYKPNVILMQAVETSATQKFNVEAVGKLCKKYNTKFMVDAISTFLLDEYLMDKWNIDVSIISSQKGLGLAPGLSMVIFKSLFYGTQSYYFDLSKYLNLSGDLGLPFTPNILVLKQLNYRLKEVIKLGLNKTIKKAEILAKDFRKKIKDLPFTLIAETPSNCATGLYTKRTDVKKLFKHLLTKNIYFVPSGGEAGKKFIVGHMGNLTVNDNTVLVRELKKWLKRK